MMSIDRPNLHVVDDFVAHPDVLFVFLRDPVQWDEKMKARKTASFGVSYDYSGMTYPQTDMPEEISVICDKIQQEIGFRPDNCLMNFYLDGKSSMGYHSDSAQDLAENTGVVIISLGAKRHINYKSKANPSIVIQYPLPSGTLLHMDNDVQEKWLHAIPKEQGVGGRISLTFRHIVKAQ